MAGGAQQGTTQQSPYANSGLARFGSIQAYQPTPYQPMLFQAPQMAERKTFQTYGGLLSTQPAADVGSSSAAVGDPATSTTADNATVGTVGQLGQIGQALGLLGPIGAVGQAVSIGQSASNGNVGPGDDAATDASSVGAVNGMDAASDAAGSGGSGGGK